MPDALCAEHCRQQAFEDASRDMAVGALAYDTTPLGSIGKLDRFLRNSKALVTDKGGMIFHMLRCGHGDEAFDKSVKQLMAQYAGRPVSVPDFQEIAEKNRPEADVILCAVGGRHRRTRNSR